MSSFKVGDPVVTRLKACIFPDDKGPSIMASKGRKGVVKRLPNDASSNYIVSFDVDGKGFWSTFGASELDLVSR